nr:hypothetical protein [Tanacetum cinerariifolium]
MDSEQYRLADQTIRAEIQRVERNAEGTTAKLRVVQAEHRATVAKQYQPEENALAAETSQLEESERQIRARRSDL